MAAALWIKVPESQHVTEYGQVRYYSGYPVFSLDGYDRMMKGPVLDETCSAALSPA
jgi:hypothetical protein